MHLSSSVNRERRDMVYGNHAPRGFSTNRFKAEFHPQLDHESGGGKKWSFYRARAPRWQLSEAILPTNFVLFLFSAYFFYFTLACKFYEIYIKHAKAKDFYSIYLLIYLFTRFLFCNCFRLFQSSFSNLQWNVRVIKHNKETVVKDYMSPEVQVRNGPVLMA